MMSGIWPVRQPYPTGNLSFGTPDGFSWKSAGDVVTLTFPSEAVVAAAALDHVRMGAAAQQLGVGTAAERLCVRSRGDEEQQSGGDERDPKHAPKLFAGSRPRESPLG